VLTQLTARSSVGADGSYRVELEAQDPAGSPVTGHVAISGGRLDAAINTSKALLVRRDDVTAWITADISATGTLLQPMVEGDVLIDRAEVRLVHAMPPSIAELGDVRIKGAPQPRPKPAEEGRIGLDLRVHAPRNIFVRGRGLDSEWEMDLAVRGTANKPRVTGTIEKIRGQLTLIGKSFELDRGTVRFANPVTIDPELDIALLRQAQGIRGGIVLTGPASGPSVDFVSTPSLPRSEVMPRLLFNRSAQSLTPLEGLELASGLATLMDGSGGTLDRVRGAIGLDVLRVEDTGNGTGVTVGRNLAPGVFVGANQPVDGAGRGGGRKRDRHSGRLVRRHQVAARFLTGASKFQGRTLARDKRAGPTGHRSCLQFVEIVVGAVRIMVEQGQPFDMGQFRQPNCLLPGRVAPVRTFHELRRGEHGVVNHQIGTLDQAQNILIGFPRRVCRVGDIAKRPPPELDPVADRMVRVIEHGGADRDALAQHQPVAGAEVVVLNLRPERFQRHRKQRRGHQPPQRLLQRRCRQQVSRPDTKLVAGNEGRQEKGETFDMVEMGVG